MESLLLVAVRIWALSHRQFFRPLIFANEPIEIWNAHREVFLHQVIAGVVSLVICVFVPDVAGVSDVLV